MAPKKKAPTREKIVEHYFDYVLTHDEDPKSIYIFAKEYGFEESAFYAHFTSFEALREQTFVSFHEHTLNLLVDNDDYLQQDARHQLLSYYYTLFELMNANRSYVVYALEGQKHKMQALKQLAAFRTAFKKYVDRLEIETLSLGVQQLEQIKNKGIGEAAWAQFMVTLKFWLDDTSPGFEKTDLFIEKSVNTSFDVLNLPALDSLIDFGKFLFKEKVKSNA